MSTTSPLSVIKPQHVESAVAIASGTMQLTHKDSSANPPSTATVLENLPTWRSSIMDLIANSRKNQESPSLTPAILLANYSQEEIHVAGATSFR